MATYVFRAIDLAGSAAKGEVEAASKQAVADQLKSRGLVVVDISAKHASKEINIALFERVKAGDLTILTRQLATMVASGMTLLRSLYVLEEQTESRPLRDAVVGVRKDVEAGLLFSAALARHPKVFNPLYVAMVESGEMGGRLDEALIRVADQLEKDDSLRRQVKSAMMYPSVIFSFAGIVLIAMVAFLVPVFQKTFEDFGSELPAITKVTVGLSDLVTGKSYLLIGGTVGIVFAFRQWKKSSWGRPQWDTIRLRFPFRIGPVVQRIALARWSRTLSSLIASGVPILQAIEITGKTAGNAVVERAMAEVMASVKAGGTIAAPLREAPVFPAMVCQMVGVGEETGALDTMLAKIADFYEDEVAAAIKGLTSLLEPLMIIVVGAIVGFIVISMYMPLFKVYDAIR
ncbi:MAG TPA: type II secretion system F family protein [Conexibacter sp.]|jgi:type IV pilus assembly protein PilC|nr:type II secretion system F family protein [Conexibacter sp.]